MKKLMLATFGLLSTAAFARDSQLLSCAGIATDLNDVTQKIGLSATYSDSRASDGSSRDEVISIIYQNKLFQGAYLNEEAFPGPAYMEMTDINNPQIKMFEGTYNLLLTEGAEGDTYSLRLQGKISNDPQTNQLIENYFDIDTTLICTDVSI